MTRTPRGLLASDLETDKNNTHTLDDSSHKTEIVIHKASGKKYVKKTYSFDTDSRASSSKQPSQKKKAGWGSMFSSVVSNTTAIISHSTTRPSTKDPEKLRKRTALSAQIESFYSSLARIKMGENAAETFAIYDESGLCIGTASKLIPGFISALNTNIEIKNHKEEFAGMFVIDYCLNDDDRHRGNYGINENGEICSIDRDMAGWNNTYRIKGYRTASYVVPGMADPEKCFKKTTRDIINLPLLKDQKHYYWYTSNMYYFGNAQAFKNLKSDIEFNREKYISLLQFCLIPHGTITAISKLHFSKEFEEERIKHVESLIKDQKNIYNILCQSPAVYCILKNKPPFRLNHTSESQVIEKILSTFHQHNEIIEESFQEHKDEYIKNNEIISIAEVEEQLSKFINSDLKAPKNPTFKPKPYESFAIPDEDQKEYKEYNERKAFVQKQITHRISEINRTSTSNKLITTVSSTCGYTNMTKKKGAYFREVLENAKDQTKTISEWFDTQKTPFSPDIDTGESAKFIKDILTEDRIYMSKLSGKEHFEKIRLFLEGEVGKLIKNYESHLKKEQNYYPISFAKNTYHSMSKDLGREEKKLQYCYYVMGELYFANSVQDLVDAFDFRLEHLEHKAEILEGTNTQTLYNIVQVIKPSLNNEDDDEKILTESMHVERWLKSLINKLKNPDTKPIHFPDDRSKEEFINIFENAIANLEQNGSVTKSLSGLRACLVNSNYKDKFFEEIRFMLNTIFPSEQNRLSKERFFHNQISTRISSQGSPSLRHTG